MKILNNISANHQVTLVPSCHLDFKPLTTNLLGQKKKKSSSFPLCAPSIQNIVLQFNIMEYQADTLPGVRVNNICCCVCLCMDQVISSWKTNQVDQLCFLLLNAFWLPPKSYQKLRLCSPAHSSPGSLCCFSSDMFFSHRVRIDASSSIKHLSFSFPPS